MSGIQGSKKFRERASQLRDHAALHGVTMVPGEAAALLADRLMAVSIVLDAVAERARWSVT